MFGGGAKGPGAAAGADPSAAGGALAMLGPMAGIAQAQFTQLIDQLGKSVREVHLTVMWKDGNQTETLDLVTHIVSVGSSTGAGSGDRNVSARGSTPPGTNPPVTNGLDQQSEGPWVRQDNGAPCDKVQSNRGVVDRIDGSPCVTLAVWQQIRTRPLGQGGARGGSLNPFGGRPPTGLRPSPGGGFQ